MSRPTNRQTRTRWIATSTLTLMVLAGCGTDESSAGDPSPTPSESTSSPAASPSESASESPSASPTDAAESPSETTPPADQAPSTVFFVGTTPQGPRLFGEPHPVPAADPLVGVAEVLATGSPLDPDYRNLLPAGSVSEVSADAKQITLRLADDSWASAAPGMTKAQAKLAAQQLVLTLQQAADSQAPLRVFVGESTTPAPLFGIDTTPGLQRGDELSTISPINVLTPLEGAEATGTLQVHGLANSPEANVPWRLLVGGVDGEVAVEGFATAEGWMDKSYPFAAEVDLSGLAPGSYTFLAQVADDSSGEGAGPAMDTKTITITE